MDAGNVGNVGNVEFLQIGKRKFMENMKIFS